MSKFFNASAIAGLLVLGTSGLSVPPSSGVGATHATSPTTQIPSATPSSTSFVNVCSAVQPVGFAHCDAQLRSSAGVKNADGATPAATLGDNGAYSPLYLQSAYNVASLDAGGNDGVGQIVAIVDADNNPNLASDLAYYRQHFNLPPCPTGTVSASSTGCVFEKANEKGAAAPLPPNNTGWGLEEAIDIEMVSAICPNCQILVVEAATSSMSDLGASVNTAVKLGATVVSNSYGSPEFSSENDLSNADYLHPGVPIVAAAGDNGYGVQFPAASPNVVAVGGTTLTQKTDTGTRDGSETVWSGSGSGCSLYEAKPSWQTDTSCSTRAVADVAAEANPNTGVWIYDTYATSGLYEAGGTSVATAIVSSIFALSNTTTPSTVTPAEGLYDNASALYPVTQGSNSGCGTYLCNAAMSENGYNGPTGMGTAGGSPSSLAAFRPASSLSNVPLSSDTSASTSGSPTDVEALPGDGEAVVGWAPPVNNGSSDVTSYLVSDGAGRSCTYTVTNPETDSCTVTGLTNGKSYDFSVTATNDSGTSATSIESSNVTPTDSSAVTQVAAGYDFGCVLHLDGTVSCWGVNSSGQLGDGSTTTHVSPVNVAGVTSATQIAVSSNYACALLSSGAVSCWGDNASGQLGNDSTLSSASPVVVSGISDATQLSLDSTYACAVHADGTVSCWGDNTLGQLGNGSTTASLTPTTVSTIETATSVKTSVNHACALLADGTVQCWGSGAYGALGNDSDASSTTPVAVLGVTNVTQIGAGFNNTCALLTNATVSCWGYNGEGELGNGDSTNSLVPVTVSGLTNVAEISTSTYGSCAISGGNVQCWGYHSAGQLGQGATTNSDTPVVVKKLSGATQIDQSYDYNYRCALLHSTTVACWNDEATAPTFINTAHVTSAAITKLEAKRLAVRKLAARKLAAKKLAAKKLAAKKLAA